MTTNTIQQSQTIDFNAQSQQWRIAFLEKQPSLKCTHKFRLMQNFPKAWIPQDINDICWYCSMEKVEDNDFVSQWDTPSEIDSQVL